MCMCAGGDCLKKDHCLRFTGAIYGRQDFFGTPPYAATTGLCDYFIEDRPSDEAIRAYAYILWQKMGCPEGQHEANWWAAEAHLLNLRRS